MNKKLLATAVASALTLPMAAHAVKYSASGQVNRAVEIIDDGVDTDVLHVDGDASGSRFRFTGSEDIGNGMTAGILMEIETQSNDSFNALVRQNSPHPVKITERHINLYFSGDFGKLTLGQGSDATDGVAFADLNNAWIPVENASDFGGGNVFRTGSGGFTGISAGGVTPSYDGGRTDVLRYDTPAIGPFSAAVSHSADSRVDIGVKLAGSAGVGAYDFRAGWRNHDNGSQTAETITVSGAFKFAQGTSIAAAWGEKAELGGSDVDGQYYYVKLGHDWGNNSVAADFKSSEDTALAAGCTGGTAANPACGGTSWGLGFVHTLPRPGIDLYAGYRFFELDDFSGSAEDISVFFVGSRIKFN